MFCQAFPRLVSRCAGAQSWAMVLIARQMFVFGEVQEPLPETVKLVEDVVRGQIIEIVSD